MTESVKDFYKVIPKSLIKQYRNNHKCPIKHPFRCLISGPTSSGKTNIVCNILKQMPDTFCNVLVCCKSKHEPLYEYLEMKLKDQIEFFEGVDAIPDLDTFKDYDQTLIVFDDLVNDKQNKIIDYFIRSRKIGRGFSCLYLTQSYYLTPKTIRNQCNYLILLKSANNKDLNLILSENNILNLEYLRLIYKKCTNKDKNFLLICHDNDDSKKFYHNFKNIK